MQTNRKRSIMMLIMIASTATAHLSCELMITNRQTNQTLYEKIIKNPWVLPAKPTALNDNQQRSLQLDDPEMLATLTLEWTDIIKEYLWTEHEENIPPHEISNDEAALDAAASQGETLIILRTFDRLKAIDENTQESGQHSNYRDQVPLINIPMSYAIFFFNTHGTALDRQLHTELVETCNTMTQLVEDYWEQDLRIIGLAHEVYYLAVRAKQERRVNKAFELSDDCFVLMRAALFGMQRLYPRRISTLTIPFLYDDRIIFQPMPLETYSKENGTTGYEIPTKVTKVMLELIEPTESLQKTAPYSLVSMIKIKRSES